MDCLFLAYVSLPMMDERLIDVYFMLYSANCIIHTNNKIYLSISLKYYEKQVTEQASLDFELERCNINQ